MIKKNVSPEFGANYKAGFVGFSRNSTFVSKGIRFFSNPKADIGVSHSLIVTGEDECVEADWDGVVLSSLKDKYFDDDKTDIFFKKPLHLSDTFVVAAIKTAKNELGRKYDYSLIGGFLFRIFSGLERLPFLRRFRSIFDSKKEWICSELVAKGLKAGYKAIGNKKELAKLSEYHETKITPQMLFDMDVWEAWK